MNDEFRNYGLVVAPQPDASCRSHEDDPCLSPPVLCQHDFDDNQFWTRNASFQRFQLPNSLMTTSSFANQGWRNFVTEMMSTSPISSDGTFVGVCRQGEAKSATEFHVSWSAYVGYNFVQREDGLCMSVEKTEECLRLCGVNCIDCFCYDRVLFILANPFLPDIRFHEGYALHAVQVYNRKLMPKKCDDGSVPFAYITNHTGDMILKPFLKDSFARQIPNAFKKIRLYGDRIMLPDLCLNKGCRSQGRVKSDGQMCFEVQTTGGKCIAFISQKLKLCNSTHNISDIDMQLLRGVQRKRKLKC